MHAVLHHTGTILALLGCTMLLPLLFVLLDGEFRRDAGTLAGFLLPGALAIVIGLLLRRLFREGRVTTIRAILVTSSAWAACSVFGAMPFVHAFGLNFLDAYFEAMAGFTTTGITMLRGLDEMPRSILFWRSLMQWLGGLGILTFFLAFAYKGSGAHFLYGAESHKIGVDRPVPGLRNTLKIFLCIYGGFTLLVFAALFASGIGPFDGLCHALTSVATGGFSTHDASIAFFRESGHTRHVLVEYILVAGMLLGGINFVVHYRLLRGSRRALWDNTEMKHWWGIIGAALLIVFFELVRRTGGGDPLAAPFWLRIEEQFRTGLFQVVSLATSTGFVTRDIGSPLFGEATRIGFLALMFVGGCVSSTSGGFKVQRIVILSRLVARELFRMRAPRLSISVVTVDGKPVSMDEIQRVGAIFTVWIALIAAGGVVTALLSGHGALASLSGMFSAIGNVGPCFISVGDMTSLHPAVKIVYIFGMLAGRLEILPVLLLFNWRAWAQ